MILVVLFMLLVPAEAVAATACQVSPAGARGHWSWRQIDGRRCWYRGAPGRAKRALYWRKPDPPAPRQPAAPLVFDTESPAILLPARLDAAAIFAPPDSAHRPAIEIAESDDVTPFEIALDAQPRLVRTVSFPRPQPKPSGFGALLAGAATAVVLAAVGTLLWRAYA